MNARRRKEIAELIPKLEEIKDVIDALSTEEREAFEGLSENLQGGERGQAMEAAAEMLENAANSIDEALSGLDSAKDG